MIEVQYASTISSLPTEALLQRWAQAALDPDVSRAGLVIRIVDEDESGTLNSRYCDKDTPTNVLSFPFEVPESVELDYLGDLVICAALVQQEAQQQGKSVEHHWAHLVVHGVLHLRGYDHLTETQAGEMETLEIKILAELGMPDPYTPQDMAV